MSLTPGRIVGIAVGALAILGIGVYGPAMLLGPLPAVAVETAAAAAPAPQAAQVPLPAEGASVIAAVDESGASSPIATGGEQGVVPIGGAAKLVTLLVTLDSLPLAAGSEGPGIRIGPDDYTDYLRYQAEGSRVLQVSPGDAWSQRDVLRAVLLASSNNHADTLARWAFGGVDQYTAAANEWLAANGFPNTSVADATGLSGDNVGTAAELAGLAGLVVADPALSAILDGDITGGVGVRQVPDVIGHLGEQGVRALARSYTDQAAISFVFTKSMPSTGGGEPIRLVGAMVLIPDYETLDPAVTAALDAAGQAAVPVDVITEGSAYGTAVSAWGERADLVASATRTSLGWGAAAGDVRVDVDSFTTAAAGRDVGKVTVPTPGGELASPLTLSTDIRDPGPIWRLTNPFPIIGAYLGDA
jgi:D-alanyl-D-alanine carboxypeptidase (penicillin-binding protein 5/6)